jgi:hypothetical protein
VSRSERNCTLLGSLESGQRSPARSVSTGYLIAVQLSDTDPSGDFELEAIGSESDSEPELPDAPGVLSSHILENTWARATKEVPVGSAPSPCPLQFFGQLGLPRGPPIRFV